MKASLKDILTAAESGGFAVGSFNTPNLESLRAVLAAAERNGLPVIIQHAQCHETLTPLSIMGPIMVRMAEEAAVPVCVHLDHGEDLDYLKRALDLGFNAVMFDGSTLPYEENLELSRKTVELAKTYGAHVEAELGAMGKREGGSGEAQGDDTKCYTDPDLAVDFVKDTGITALACSFGTTHGLYLTKPKLDVDVVTGVREKTGGIPIVMHGGSGISDEDFRKVIHAGVRKINYFTYMDKAGAAACQESALFFSEYAGRARAAMEDNVSKAMQVFALR